MAKLELSINCEYVRNWSVWEGVREVMQNAMDAQDDGFKMDARHNGKDTLRVSNEGVKLDPNVWLLGTTTKREGNYRGHFGEGLNLSMLALVRGGHSVKIINGDESWTPKIEPSETFNGADVLTIYTHKRHNDIGKFVIEIGGIDRETWANLKPRFLDLAKPKRVVKTTRGDVILDKAFKGKIFVKGIYVEYRAELAAGYNFRNVDTDRDRKMVDTWDLKYNAAKAWEEAMTQDEAEPKITLRVVEMLNDNALDVEQMGDGYGINKTVAEKVGEVFKGKHGESAIPVQSMAESREVEHLGKRGIVVPRPLAKLLADEVGSIESARKSFSRATANVYGWDDLNDDERDVYGKVLNLVEPAASGLGHENVENRLTVVDFNDETLNGLHHPDGKIEVARKLLGDFEKFLSVLVHEVSHDHGIDGEKDHERAEGRLFSRIIASLVRPN